MRHMALEDRSSYTVPGNCFVQGISALSLAELPMGGTPFPLQRFIPKAFEYTRSFGGFGLGVEMLGRLLFGPSLLPDTSGPPQCSV